MSWAILQDFLKLIKFRLVLLVLLTTSAGYILAGGEFFTMLFFWTVLGTALLGYTSSALNQAIEYKRDSKMERTKARPIASGRYSRNKVIFISILGSSIGVWILYSEVNRLTAFLGFLTLVSYVLLYTPLKTRTSLNTLIGAIPGAIPPLMGWTAFRNNIDFLPVILFAILFLWQIPHFLAIGILYKRDFEDGGFAMLPNLDKSGVETTWQIVLYTIALILVSLIPSIYGFSGKTYFVGSMMLGLGFLYFALCTVFVLGKTETHSKKHANRLFLYSIIYLPALLMLLFFDNNLGSYT